MGQDDHQATGADGVGRFLRGTITERFLWPRREDGLRGGAGAVFAAPITVTLTDEIRRITDTLPVTERAKGGMGRAINEITETIPVLTTTITDDVTIITETVTVIG